MDFINISPHIQKNRQDQFKFSYEDMKRFPLSKSALNRALILGAQWKGFKILFPYSPKYSSAIMSTDTQLLLQSFEKIGLCLMFTEEGVEFLNSFPECENMTHSKEVIPLITRDGGTTNRFLLALLSLGKRIYRLEVSALMYSRPMDDLIDALSALGSDVQKKVEEQDGVQKYFFQIDPLQMNSPKQFHNGERVIEIRCDKTTQFYSALKLISAKKQIRVIPTEVSGSQKYLAMTDHLESIQRMGESHFFAPHDMSSLSYLLVMGLLVGNLTIDRIQLDPLQADYAFLDLIQKNSWAEVKISPTEHPHFDQVNTYQTLSLKTRSNNFSAFGVSALEYPDLIPTLVVFSVFVEGVSVFYDLKNLIYKETDRVMELRKLLTLFRVRHEYDEQTYSLKVFGNTPDQHELLSEEIIYHAPEDHRMIMAGSLLLKFKTLNGGQVSHSGHVKKSFPEFFYFLRRCP